MTIKTLAAAVALTLVPVMGFAQACDHGKQQEAAVSCAEGSVYDTQMQRCVPTTG